MYVRGGFEMEKRGSIGTVIGLGEMVGGHRPEIIMRRRIEPGDGRGRVVIFAVAVAAPAANVDGHAKDVTKKGLRDDAIFYFRSKLRS